MAREPGVALLPPEPSPDGDWFHDDPALARFLELYEDPATLKAAEPFLAAMGALAPSRLDALARLANKERPVLERVREEHEGSVRYCEAYREIQRLPREHGVMTLAWEPLGERGRAPRTVHFALGYLFAQAEAGSFCPACLTDAAAFVLARHAPAELRDAYVPRLLSRSAGETWEGGILLTERSGGSDLARTATRAEPGPRGTWLLHGEKGFA